MKVLGKSIIVLMFFNSKSKYFTTGNTFDEVRGGWRCFMVGWEVRRYGEGGMLCRSEGGWVRKGRG